MLCSHYPFFSLSVCQVSFCICICFHEYSSTTKSHSQLHIQQLKMVSISAFSIFFLRKKYTVQTYLDIVIYNHHLCSSFLIIINILTYLFYQKFYSLTSANIQHFLSKTNPTLIKMKKRIKFTGINSRSTFPRACLKKAFRELRVPVCGRFYPNESGVAGYGNRIRVKYTAKWGLQIAEMIFQTRSSHAKWRK